MNSNNPKIRQEGILYIPQANQDLIKVMDMIKVLTPMQLKSTNIMRELRNLPRKIDLSIFYICYTIIALSDEFIFL